MSHLAPETHALTRDVLRRAAAELARRDPDLRRILQRLGPPPLWARPPGFRTLIRIVLEQQVSLASARATFERLLRRVRPFTPARFAAIGEGRVRSFGVTRQKAGYCLHLAAAILDGRLDLRAVSRMDDATAASALTGLKGIGPWTADIYLLMALRRPDVWPTGDIALARSAREIKRLRRRPSAARLARLALDWRPYRSVAARMLWQHYLAERDGRTAPVRGCQRPDETGRRPRRRPQTARGSFASASRMSDGSARR